MPGECPRPASHEALSPALLGAGQSPAGTLTGTEAVDSLGGQAWHFWPEQSQPTGRGTGFRLQSDISLPTSARSQTDVAES